MLVVEKEHVTLFDARHVRRNLIGLVEFGVRPPLTRLLKRSIDSRLLLLADEAIRFEGYFELINAGFESMMR